jgi:hypothetical protein
MNATELRELGEKTYGWGWQTRLAREIGMSLRQVQRYAAGETPVPAPTAKLIRILTALA